MIARKRSSGRGAATTVEMAVVLSVFLLFLFGIFEYCRYLMMIQVATNAARDGARYAVVNLGKGPTFDVTDYDDGVTLYPSIEKHVDNKMAGLQASIDGYDVTVFACDSAQLALPTPVVAIKPSSTWNQVRFGERVAVRITGNYKTILPSFLMFGAGGIPVNVVVTMGSEG